MKDTLQNIQFYHNTSNALKRQNSDLLADVQSMKAVLKEHRVKETNEAYLNEKNYSDLLTSNKALEDKLVHLKIDYATKAQDIEELKDTIEKVNNTLLIKDNEIMRLNKELEKVNQSLSESEETHKPPRQSIGTPKKPVLLQRPKKE